MILYTYTVVSAHVASRRSHATRSRPSLLACATLRHEKLKRNGRTVVCVEGFRSARPRRRPNQLGCPIMVPSGSSGIDASTSLCECHPGRLGRVDQRHVREAAHPMSRCWLPTYVQDTGRPYLDGPFHSFMRAATPVAGAPPVPAHFPTPAHRPDLSSSWRGQPLTANG